MFGVKYPYEPMRCACVCEGEGNGWGEGGAGAGTTQVHACVRECAFVSISQSPLFK